MRIMDLIESFGSEIETEVIGLRPGEKLHETMFSKDDAQNTIEFDNHYVISNNPIHRQ